VILMWDASTPPVRWPAGFNACAGYIGGDTPHVWSKTEWERFGKRKKLPIYVQNHPNVNMAEQEGFAALRRLYQIGCPKGSPVVWDAEGAINKDWSNLFASVIYWGGYRFWTYGEASTVYANPLHGGFWAASWHEDAKPYALSNPRTNSTQYADGKLLNRPYDASTLKPFQYYFRLKTW
jgi:hypothetical protein